MLSPFSSLSQFGHPRFVAGGGGPTPLITSFVLGGVGTVADPRGMRFTVGAANITATELGVLGNPTHYSSTLAIALYDASASQVGGGTVSGWGTDNTLFYWTAITPVIMLAGQVYYLDAAWAFNDAYNGSTSVAATSAVTVDGSTFSIDSIDVAGAYCFGPLNLKL